MNNLQKRGSSLWDIAAEEKWNRDSRRYEADRDFYRAQRRSLGRLIRRAFRGGTEDNAHGLPFHPACGEREIHLPLRAVIGVANPDCGTKRSVPRMRRGWLSLWRRMDRAVASGDYRPPVAYPGPDGWYLENTAYALTLMEFIRARSGASLRVLAGHCGRGLPSCRF
jgi:hypothetical protein